MLHILILASNVQLMTCSRRHLCSSYSANVSKVISPGTIYNLLELTWNRNKLTGGRMVSVVLCLNNNNNNNNNIFFYNNNTKITLFIDPKKWTIYRI